MRAFALTSLRAGNVYALFEDERGEPATEVDAHALPEITLDWVSAKDGTRTPPHLDDRAASYDRRRNRLEINADFRGFTALLRRWETRYSGVAGAAIAIAEIAASWWQQGWKRQSSVSSPCADRSTGMSGPSRTPSPTSP